ncbi:MAG: ABC transporter ATP-binding protein [Deltaproteobacteria bacterium]|nr:ABC transporter ATP-binding protein [Deltaproteobacteria bacterium]MBW2016826.1 ABC transporter ATP-binding protein [Deltaproteobacteria bacterium]MBW2129492.1 ABC transporter ATP-binding protein [Deltaproteobacteria bacterium]MBW2303833.1 ABC transporter ATP-binding protein [Deltaproteobacteria bacterium]
MHEKSLFEVEDVCFSYGREPVLEHLSFTIDPGLFYVIVGPNGCGKTTLVDLLTGRKRPASGTIRFRGRRVDSYRKRALARMVALVPQDFQVYFDFTVQEVVMMGRHPFIKRFEAPSGEDLRIVGEVMRETGVYGFRDKLITELSGGEKQRVVFARALAQRTPVLILDEATSNMDIRFTLDLLDLVSKRVRAENHTVVAVMHDLILASLYSDRIIFMKGGRVFAEGDTDEVLSEKNIGEVFNVEARVTVDAATCSRHVIFKRRGTL